jgi:serine/threonine protein kinase/formylglycine-generating enzyme required for sulfatase activity
MSEASAFTPPQEFDEYRLIRQLGRGGMGQVYLAQDLLLDRLVAVKFIASLDPDPVARDRFLVEARAVARLQHPNVVAVYRVGEAAGHPYQVSEFVRGQSLDRVPVPLQWPQLLRHAVGLARGLAAAHRRGVLHRDLKPANAILAEGGEVKLLDFGLAKLLEVAAPSETLEDTAVDSTETDPAAAAVQARFVAAEAGQTLPGDEAFTGGGLLGRTTPLSGALDETRAASPDLAATVAGPDPLAATRVAAAGPATAGVTSALGEARGGAALRAGAASRTSGSRAAPPSRTDLTRAGAFLGTPLYMAPEIWQGEQATVRSDVYSFGVLLFYLASGRPPFEATSLPQLMAAVCMRDAPALATVAPGVDPGFAVIVDRCLRREPAGRFGSGEEVREALEQLTPEARVGVVPQGNPYRGLHPFEAEHRALFFGRGSDVGAVVERLRAEPFVLVAGDSGVGKSSLCRAGVIPAVLEGALGGERTWRTARLVPGRRPVAALAAALAPLLEADEEAVTLELGEDPAGLVRRLRQRLGDRAGLLLLLDQAEELVTIADPGEAAVVAQAVAHLGDGGAGVRLLATVRGDFLTRLAALPGLGDELGRAFYLLRPLTVEGIREAVVGPARAKGVSFESPALVDELAASVTGAAGALPLLQFALAELWEKRDSARAVIPAAGLQAIGGVSGALARHADAVVAGLLPRQREAARRVLLRLVSAAGTRVGRGEAELGGDDAAARGALDALVRGRLVTARDADAGAVYEVAHEALLGGWPTLRDWLDADAGARVVRERLAAAAAEWERLGRPHDALWGPRQLAEVAALPPGDLPARDVAFLAAARGAVRRRWVQRGAAAVALVVLVAAVFGVNRYLGHARVQARVRGHVTVAMTELATARQRARAASAVRTQALQHFDARRKESGEGAWSRALRLAGEADRHFGRASQSFEAALAEDPSRRDLRVTLADALFERALQAEGDRRSERVEELLERLRVYDDGGVRAARWREPATVSVDSTPAGATVTVGRYVPDDHGRRRLTEELTPGRTPLRDLRLPPGSYLLTLGAPGRAQVRHPLLVARGTRHEVAVDLPAAAAVPAGFVYVPPGAFLFGSFADERMRREFLMTVPAHEVRTDGYLIARHETTYGEWLEFLQALPADERRRRTPKTATAGFHGAVELKEQPGGDWLLTIQPDAKSYSARRGEKLRYPARRTRSEQDWSRFPVSGVSTEDVLAYTAWLSRTGRVPGARLCTEHEWERAARGADDRELPHGDRLEPDDANFDETYGRQPLGFGIDEVGAHPASRSPFGLDDMSGNVLEWTVSSLVDKEWVVRGGAYYYGQNTCMITNRQPTSPAVRDFTVGFRVCAPLTRP